MFNINLNQPTYDPVAVQPMRDELIAAGFTEILSPADMDAFINRKDDKTVLVMINSVCGCAAGSARPGLTLALQNMIIPDELYTTFAGQDKAAVAALREKYLTGIAPSSPFIVLFKNGEIIFKMQRFDIEGKTAEMVAGELTEAFNKLCTRQGPSIPPEDYAKLVHAIACGSKIPLAKN
jgi:putative YphP/YqiW family bacilliredoxin